MANIEFISECRKTIQGMKNRTVLTADGEFYRTSTIRTITTNLNKIEEYFLSLGYNVGFNDIDFQFTEDFRMWLIQKNHAKNTVSQNISAFRFWIRRFHKFGMMKYSGAGMRTLNEITTAVINTVDDLRLLYHLDLPQGKRRVLDIYICQCFLGLRISDMFSFLLKINNTIKIVDGKTYFEIKTQKTGAVVVIPAAKIVLEILEKYNYDFGEGFSEWYYNRTLKEIIAETKIEKEVLFHRTEGGERIERVKLFSEMIGSHTARRTFASNAYLMGIDPLDVMKITGHKSYNSFFKYLRCENLGIAMRISTHEFFNINFDESN